MYDDVLTDKQLILPPATYETDFSAWALQQADLLRHEDYKEPRQQIRRLLKKSPSLRPLLPDAVNDVYDDARDLATDDLALDDLRSSALPVRCPWTVEQILDQTWLPALPL